MADQWDHTFETAITITVGTDMMGHVRVTGTHADTGHEVQREVLVVDDDPNVTAQKVGDVMREVFIVLDQD